MRDEIGRASCRVRANIASHFFDLVIGKILTSRLSLSKHLAHNLGNLLLLGKIGFFFKTEDGIRSLYVTGVQTCALPISRGRLERFLKTRRLEPIEFQAAQIPGYARWVPIHQRVGQGDVYLVGDAAGQVKITTVGGIVTGFRGDRKSTRLNSSHVEISYAVFCL